MKKTKENNEVAEKDDGKKKISKLKVLSIIWTLLSFCIYIALDVNKIYKNGWTPVNIIVTVFLGLQILLFIVFTALGAKSKEDAKMQKMQVILNIVVFPYCLALLTVKYCPASTITLISFRRPDRSTI